MEEGQRSERDERELMARTRLGQLLVTQPGFIDELLLDLDKTRYEELTCVGLQPDQATLYATIAVKQDFGYGGDLCTGPGGREYVRFFADWNGDGDFTDPDEDLGVASVAVHDIPGPKPLTYAVSLTLTRRQLLCFFARPITVRAVLMYNTMPSAGDPNPQIVWGNIRQVDVQPATRRFHLGDVLKHLDVELKSPIAKLVDLQAEVGSAPSSLSAAELIEQYGDRVPVHRALTPQLAEVTNRLATDAGTAAQLPAVLGKILPLDLVGKLDVPSLVGAFLDLQGNTTFEELHCVGLHPDLRGLVGVLDIKQPTGYSGGLCTDGSLEYVAFWADWNDDGTFDEYLGTAVVRVHDEPTQGAGISFSVFLPVSLDPYRRPCGGPNAARIRAVLSWNVPPSTTDPFAMPAWGNAVETHIQLPVGDPITGQVPFISVVGGMAVSDINASGYATGTAVTAGFHADQSPFAQQVVIAGHISNPPNLSVGAPPLAYGLHYRHEAEPPGTAHAITNPFQITLSQYSAFTWSQTSGSQLTDPVTGRYTYREDLTLEGPGGDQTFVEGFVLGRWLTGGLPDGRYQVWMSVDLGGGVIAESNRVWVRLDNSAPIASLTLDGSPFVPQGTDVTGTFTATDDHLAGFSLGVLPAGFPTAPVPAGGFTPASGSPFTLSTTAASPGGYVLQLVVTDRAIVNSGYIGQQAADHVGFCVEQP